MGHIFPELMETLHLPQYFANISTSCEGHKVFTRKYSKLVTDEKGNLRPLVDVVIFTGTPETSASVRNVYNDNVLLIANGSGHNPHVVTETADIDLAVDSTIQSQLYNQGQDCTAPNSILVQRSIYERFVNKLEEKIKMVKVGPYSDRDCMVGPISKGGDVKRIADLIYKFREKISKAGEGVIRMKSQTVEPTIIEIPLAEGGNFTEQFAPIFFIQAYETDDQLAQYFEDPNYAKQAMYVCVFGESRYIYDLKQTGLHNETTIVHNSNLSDAGVDKGAKAFGGFGMGASYVSIDGQSIAKPTLPQRDIYEYLIKPQMN